MEISVTRIIKKHSYIAANNSIAIFSFSDIVFKISDACSMYLKSLVWLTFSNSSELWEFKDKIKKHIIIHDDSKYETTMIKKVMNSQEKFKEFYNLFV